MPVHMRASRVYCTFQQRSGQLQRHFVGSLPAAVVIWQDGFQVEAQASIQGCGCCVGDCHVQRGGLQWLPVPGLLEGGLGCPLSAAVGRGPIASSAPSCTCMSLVAIPCLLQAATTAR